MNQGLCRADVAVGIVWFEGDGFVDFTEYLFETSFRRQDVGTHQMGGRRRPFLGRDQAVLCQVDGTLR